MSIKAMNWAWQIDLVASKKLTLLCLADHADNDGVCWPGIAAVMEKTGLSRRTVINFLSEFEAGGLLHKKDRKGPNGRQMVSVIELNLKAERFQVGPPATIEPGANSAPGESVEPGAKIDTYRVQKTAKTGCKNGPVCNEEPNTEPKTESSRKKSSPDQPDPEDDRLARWMFGLILKLHPKHGQPNFTRWADEIRLMRVRDKRDHSEIARLFRWANGHQFWCTNILSPAKLRQQWDRLHIQRAADTTASGAMVRMMTAAPAQPVDRSCSHLDGAGHRCGRVGVTSLGNHATSPWRCAEHAEVDIGAEA